MTTVYSRRRNIRSGPAFLPISILALILLPDLALCQSNAQSPAPAAQTFAPLPDPPKIDERRAELGKILFFDSRLSGDTANACSTCHDPGKGWADGKPLSAGYTSVEYFRNAPSLFNSFARKRLTWDARLDGSDPGTLVRDMLTEAHTMNADTRIVQERLKQVPQYADAFKAAFGADPYGGMIYGAVAEFLKTIRTTGAPFDKFLRGDTTALSAQQKVGMELFSGKAGCGMCHSGAMLSDSKPYATGVPEHPELASNASRQITMLRHYSTFGVPNFMNLRKDVGYYIVTKDEADIGKFLTPSLWDAGQTAPYMHNGVFATLEEVVEFYDRGGGQSQNKPATLKPLNLTAEEKQALVAFLQSLTGDRPAATPPNLPDYGMRAVGTN
ncbi:cytochrome-c peroxidase [Bradyrhizobium sp.]|uniref:cytochrome-c peroxidase n=1 Tax=Bradyrhizobium sp. TaxID=376 RepID=UPI0040378613